MNSRSVHTNYHDSVAANYIDSTLSSDNGFAFNGQSVAVDGFYVIMVSGLWYNSGSLTATSRLRFMDVRTEQWTTAPYGRGNVGPPDFCS